MAIVQFAFLLQIVQKSKFQNLAPLQKFLTKILLTQLNG